MSWDRDACRIHAYLIRSGDLMVRCLRAGLAVTATTMAGHHSAPGKAGNAPG